MKKLDRAVHIEAARVLLVQARDMLYKAEEKIHDAGEATEELESLIDRAKISTYSITIGCIEILNKLGVK